jgi:hypothetical protein
VYNIAWNEDHLAWTHIDGPAFKLKPPLPAEHPRGLLILMGVRRHHVSLVDLRKGDHQLAVPRELTPEVFVDLLVGNVFPPDVLHARRSVSIRLLTDKNLLFHGGNI